MLETVIVISLIFLPFMIAFTLWQKRTKTIKNFKHSNLVLVHEKNASPGLPADSYGIPLKINEQGEIQVVFPRLTNNGCLEYIYYWHDLEDIDVIEPELTPKTLKLSTFQKLAPIIKDHLQIENEISALEAEYYKIRKLAKLVATSDIYSEQINMYDTDLMQIKKLLKKAEGLHKMYINLVREVLIGAQVAEYNPEYLPNLQRFLNLQEQQIKEEYNNMKDVVTAYSQLLKESRNTQL